MKLHEPNMRDLEISGKPFRVLLDLAAAMDKIHSSYVELEMFTGECACIKQVVEAHSASLPVAKVTIKGPFGTLEQEAAVSPMLPPQYPYLFSNRSDQILCEKGLMFGEASVMALTKSSARELIPQALVELEMAEAEGFLESQKAQVDNSSMVKQHI